MRVEWIPYGVMDTNFTASQEANVEPSSEAGLATFGAKFSEMRRRFARWKRENPELETETELILRQFDLLKKQRRILKDLLRDKESCWICEEHTTLFNKLVDQIRQNFVDMMNIFILAGANFGEAQRGDLDACMLEGELDDNLKKFEMLKRINKQVLKTINAHTDIMADVVTECEISALEKANEMKTDADEAMRILTAGGSPFMEQVVSTESAQNRN